MSKIPYYPTAPISCLLDLAKRVHISLFSSALLCPRKMTLLWNGAKFVACRGTAGYADILVVIRRKTEFAPDAFSLV